MTREEYIKQLIKAKGLTLKEFAKENNIPYTTLLHITNNSISGAAVDTVIKICKSLGIKVDQLEEIENKDIKIHQTIYSSEEHMLIEKYKELDKTAKKIVDFILTEDTPKEQPKQKPRPKFEVMPQEEQTKYIDIFDLPVSAGTGIYLDTDYKDMFEIPLNNETADANFALRVSGDSMEPDYFDGDIILIKSQPQVDIGELGIFIYDNEGYFKKWDGDKLVSLNKKYKDIKINSDNFYTKGRVIGKL